MNEKETTQDTTPNAKQARFIELRASGMSYARIAQELDVCKRTLINWSRKFQFEIQNQRAIALEALQEQLIASHEVRTRALADQLRQVEEELKKRDLAELSTSRLLTLRDSWRRQIQRETGDLHFVSPIEEIPGDEYREQVQQWRP